MENPRMLSANAPPERLLEFAAITGFDEVIDSLPMKFHTPLPRGGAILSGGQRQLLALTAALASDRDTLLLDEPTANIDALGATRLTDILHSQAKTIIIAGHAEQLR